MVTVLKQNYKELKLGTNQITEIGDKLGNLTKLTVLELHENRLKSLPSSIGNCQCLVSVFLQKNSLESIPFEIGLKSVLLIEK